MLNEEENEKKGWRKNYFDAQYQNANYHNKCEWKKKMQMKKKKRTNTERREGENEPRIDDEDDDDDDAKREEKRQIDRRKIEKETEYSYSYMRNCSHHISQVRRNLHSKSTRDQVERRK